jgi:hypothetical protein
MRWCAREGYWKEELERLRKKTDFVDADKAERLKAEGVRAAMDDNGKLLHGAVRSVYALLPLMQQTKLNDIFKDAGLTPHVQREYAPLVRLHLLQGKPDLEARIARLRLHAHVTAMHANDSAHHVQAKSQPASRSLGSEERLEDPPL